MTGYGNISCVSEIFCKFTQFVRGPYQWKILLQQMFVCGSKPVGCHEWFEREKNSAVKKNSKSQNMLKNMYTVL